MSPWKGSRLMPRSPPPTHYHTNNINGDTYQCPKSGSNPRFHCPLTECITRVRPRDHRDHLYSLLYHYTGIALSAALNSDSSNNLCYINQELRICQWMNLRAPEWSRKAPVSCVMSVRLSICPPVPIYHHGSHGMDSRDI